MERIGPQLGTNPGSICKDTLTGREYYVKRYRDPSQSACEWIANKVYQAVGAPVLDVNFPSKTWEYHIRYFN